MINTEKYTSVLINFKLTPDQFLLVMFLLKNKLSFLYKYSETYEEFKKADVSDLLEREILEKPSYSRGGLHNDNLVVSKRFQKSLFQEYPELMFEVLWNNYPNSIMSNGKKEYAKQTNKEELGFAYTGVVEHNIEQHFKIMDDLHELKINKKVDFTLDEFLDSHLN